MQKKFVLLTLFFALFISAKNMQEGWEKTFLNKQNERLQKRWENLTTKPTPYILSIDTILNEAAKKKAIVIVLPSVPEKSTVSYDAAETKYAEDVEPKVKNIREKMQKWLEGAKKMLEKTNKHHTQKRTNTLLIQYVKDANVLGIAHMLNAQAPAEIDLNNHQVMKDAFESIKKHAGSQKEKDYILIIKQLINAYAEQQPPMPYIVILNFLQNNLPEFAQQIVARVYTDKNNAFYLDTYLDSIAVLALFNEAVQGAVQKLPTSKLYIDFLQAYLSKLDPETANNLVKIFLQSTGTPKDVGLLKILEPYAKNIKK